MHIGHYSDSLSTILINLAMTDLLTYINNKLHAIITETNMKSNIIVEYREQR